MRNLRLLCTASSVSFALALVGCKKDEPEPEPEQPTLAVGEACDPEARPIGEWSEDEEAVEPPAICAPGLACEPVAGSDAYVCGAALEIRGRVVDSETGDPLSGALVAALNESSEPVTDVAVTDACGNYILPVTVRRTPEGEYAETLKWTLIASAQDHLPFPGGFRPALPVDMADAVAAPQPEAAEVEAEDEVYISYVIDNAATHIALIPLEPEDRGGAIVSGVVRGGGTAGTLVVAEHGGGQAAPYAIADASGAYTLFNVPTGEATIRGYHRGLEIDPANVSATGNELTGIDLVVASSEPAELGRLSGSLEIVDAPGDSVTSVVLVPASVFNEVLERGPVPVGLRIPDPPLAPDVAGTFELSEVPSGTYKVLVAFENDGLVRDPDEGIAGTAILEVTVGRGEHVTLQDSFKVTEALAVYEPGADGPQLVEETPTLVWADDAGEDGYDLVVFDALGEVVWEHDVPSVEGSETVSVPYGGPPLEPGMYYQFRATSYRTLPNARFLMSRTETLRGVFTTGDAPPMPACEVADADTTD